jgi:hypothetical protein
VKRKSEQPLSDAWIALTRQVENGKPRPKASPSGLPLRSIKLWPGVFQHRGRMSADGERHVRDLAAAIKKSKTKTLDPIKVWWDGKAWACIDGHHRIDAYRQAVVGSGSLVPVEVFGGSLEQAMAVAAEANTKDKLPMSSRQKSNSAWRMVAVTTMSKALVAKSAGVSESTVATMRRAQTQLAALQADEPDSLDEQNRVDYRDLGWADAKRLAEGREGPGFDWQAANVEKAQEMALALRKALGKEGGKYPEILAMALDIYDTRLMDRLVEWWGPQQDQDELDENSEAA